MVKFPQYDRHVFTWRLQLGGIKAKLKRQRESVAVAVKMCIAMAVMISGGWVELRRLMILCLDDIAS
jgi:hypothetical protein